MIWKAQAMDKEMEQIGGEAVLGGSRRGRRAEGRSVVFQKCYGERQTIVTGFRFKIFLERGRDGWKLRGINEMHFAYENDFTGMWDIGTGTGKLSDKPERSGRLEADFQERGSEALHGRLVCAWEYPDVHRERGIQCEGIL